MIEGGRIGTTIWHIEKQDSKTDLEVDYYLLNDGTIEDQSYT
jgi:hypothetical protein